MQGGWQALVSGAGIWAALLCNAELKNVEGIADEDCSEPVIGAKSTDDVCALTWRHGQAD